MGSQGATEFGDLKACDNCYSHIFSCAAPKQRKSVIHLPSFFGDCISVGLTLPICPRF